MAVFNISTGRFPSYKTGIARSGGESAYPSLWRGLVGYWAPRAGNTYFTIPDLSNNGNDMQNQGWGVNSWVTANEGNTYLNLQGTNDFIKGPDTLELQRGFSICAYGMISSITATQRATLYARRDSTNYAFHFRINQSGGKLSALWTSGSVDSSLGPTLGQYHMMGVTATRTGGTIFYLDDQKDNKGGTRTITPTNGSFISIGSHSDGSSDHWIGNIGYVGIWNRELTDSEFNLMYKGASPLHRRQRIIGKVPVVGGTTVPIFDHHYRMLRSA